jgi:hypothetical protein
MRDQSIDRGEIDARLPLLLRYGGVARSLGMDVQGAILLSIKFAAQPCFFTACY